MLDRNGQAVERGDYVKVFATDASGMAILGRVVKMEQQLSGDYQCAFTMVCGVSKTMRPPKPGPPQKILFDVLPVVAERFGSGIEWVDPLVVRAAQVTFGTWLP